MERGANLHHPFFTRKAWEADGTAKRLRNDGGTHVVLPIWVHETLHQQVEGFLPPIPEHSRIAIDMLSSRYDSLDNLRMLCAEMYRYDEGVAEGLMEQLPYLIVGVKALKRRFI